MADDANQPLPRLTLLFAQRLTDVGQHEHLVRLAALPELPPSDLPSPGSAGKADVLNAGVGAERRHQPELLGGPSDERVGPLRQQPLAVPVDQDETLVVVEREDGDVDFRHHRPQQRRRLLRIEPLRAHAYRRAD